MMAEPLRWGGKPYHSLDHYLKETYHTKTMRIALNAGLSCPNRDGTLGTGGCAFCSAGGSGDFAGSPALSISEQLREAKAVIRSKRPCDTFIAYFQAFTNTYAPVARLRELYTEAAGDPEVAVLSIATRPDCLPDKVISLLAETARHKDVWVELGLQTIHDQTRASVNSNFTYSVFTDAVARLQNAGIPVVAHLILGLPAETKDMMLSSVQAVAALPIWGIKLQLLHILQGTALAHRYQTDPFPVFALEDYCETVIDCLELLPPEMIIHRLTGDGPKELLTAPLWAANKRNVLNRIHRRMKERNSWQGKRYVPLQDQTKISKKEIPQDGRTGNII